MQWHPCKLSLRNLCAHYGLWHYEPRCLSSLWFVAFYVSVLMLLFRLTYSRLIGYIMFPITTGCQILHNVAYLQWPSSVVDTKNLGHILQLVMVFHHWRVEIAQWFQSQCESPGGAMKRLVVYCCFCQRSYRGDLPHTCHLLEVTEPQLPMGHVCITILLHCKKNIFWHGQKSVWF